MTTCEDCIKAMTLANCKRCPANPKRYLLTFTVHCTNCETYKIRKKFGCKPQPDSGCPRADKLMAYLLLVGVITKEDYGEMELW